MNIEYEARDQYLYVKVTGEFVFREAQDSVPEGFRRCIEHNLKKVLVDLRELRGENSRPGRYFYLDGIGELHDEYVKAGYAPLSVVYVGSSEFVSDDKYEETVAGLHALNIKTTADMNEGLEWLNARQDQPAR